MADNIMKVREIIDAAFGDDERNKINFKYIQTVLFLIANQLRILERRVEVEFEPMQPITGRTISISEVRIHAKSKKKRKQKLPPEREKHDREVKGGKSRKAKAGKEKGDKSYSDKGSKYYSSSSRDKESLSSQDDRTSSSKDITLSSKDKTTSSSKDQTTSSSKDKTTSSSKDKSTSSSRLQTTSSSKGQETSSSKDRTSSSTKDQTTTSSKDRTTTPSKDQTTSSSKDKTTSSSKDQLLLSSKDQTTSSSKLKSSSSSQDRRTERRTEKPGSEEGGTKSSQKRSLGSDDEEDEESDTEVERGERGRKSSSRSIRSEDWDEDQAAANKGGKSSDKRQVRDGKKKTESYHRILEKEEERREKLLRVIHQRTDSFDTTTKTPTPMASVGSMEKQEKLFVVERVPSSTSRRSSHRTPEISVVTRQQFDKLVKEVRKLEKRLLPVGTAAFPERAELMHELRRDASLTDAMAALQLSARLEATEKAIDRLMPMITDLAKLSPETAKELAKMHQAGKQFQKMGREFSRTKMGSQKSPRGKRGASSMKLGGHGASPGAGGARGVHGSSTSPGRSPSSHRPAEKTKRTQEPGAASETDPDQPLELTYSDIKQPTVKSAQAEESESDEFSWTPQYVTYPELDRATKEMNDFVMQSFKNITTRATTNAEQATKIAAGLEGKIETALAACTRMVNLEAVVSQYAEQINALDTGLSSQMTNYQEQLTQMQHNLEIGLETMTEVLANAGGDTVAVAELNSHFTSLQTDFDNMMYRQKELKETLDSVSFDLQYLWKQIEMLRETKSDREEVTDALRDKAGIGLLNGLVSLMQFEAVRGELEKRINDAYDKFNNQEIVWQKAIYDLLRELNEKADQIQIESLRDEINKYLKIMNEQMQVIIDIVGEPKSAALSKKLFRNTTCLSCGSPAHMDIEEPGLVPLLPRFHKAKKSAGDAESLRRAKGDGDHELCYPGLPIRHPRDPRSHICQRYCGGSHTVVNEPPCKVPSSLGVKPVRDVKTQQGIDGKMYLVDASEMKPCIPCNIPSKSPPPSPKTQDVEEGPTSSAGDNITTTEDTKDTSVPEPEAGNVNDVADTSTPTEVVFVK